MPRASLMLATLVSVAFAAEAASDEAIASCRAIRDSAARLACYDGLTIGATPGAKSPAPATAPAQAAPPQEAARFGLSARTQPEPLQAIETHIPGHFSGWQPGGRIRLANGQVWQVTDGSSRFADLDNPKVTVRRGMLGSFFLDIDGVNPAPRVRRIE